MEENILKILQEEANNSKNLSHQTIAKFILNNIDNISNLKTSEIAVKSFSSSAGVIRFCKKIGFQGINELKYAIKKLNSQLHLESFQININNSLATAENKFFENYLQIKYETSLLVHNNFLNKDWTELINKIIQANTIYIFGFNLSYNFSRNFVQRLRWINKNVVNQNDLNSIDSYIPMINEDDLVIYLTLSGESQLIYSIAQQINKKCYSFGLIGKTTNLNEYLSDYFVIESKENEIWDVYSIRAQALAQFLDYLYAKVIKIKIN